MVPELQLLATAPKGLTKESPVCGTAQTPCLYKAFIPMLFVGFAHNLYVESAVSKLANLEKTHPGADSLVLQEMYMYVRRQPEQHATSPHCAQVAVVGSAHARRLRPISLSWARPIRTSASSSSSALS